MCLGGKGDGGAGAAERAEQERQAQIAATTGRIRSLFDDPSRETEYAAHRQNVLDYNMDAHTQRSEDAARELRFALARRGLSGGSAHADAKQRLDRNIGDEAIRIGQYADTAANNLRGADQRAKQTLITQAQTGLDATTATQQALSDMRLNLDQAAADTAYDNVGNLMGNIALLNQVGAQAQGRARARNPIVPSSRETNTRYSGNTTRIG